MPVKIPRPTYESFEVFRSSYEILHNIYTAPIHKEFQLFFKFGGYTFDQCKSLSSHIPIHKYWTLAHLLRVVPNLCSSFRLLLLVSAIFWSRCFFFPWPPPISATLSFPSMPEGNTDRDTLPNHCTMRKSSNNLPKMMRSDCSNTAKWTVLF